MLTCLLKEVCFLARHQSVLNCIGRVCWFSYQKPTVMYGKILSAEAADWRGERELRHAAQRCKLERRFELQQECTGTSSLGLQP